MKGKSHRQFVLIALALISVGSLIHLFSSIRNTPTFIDEENLISAAKNFFTHGDYSPYLVNIFDPGVSSGLWCTFPSGIAATFGAPLSQIRLTSYLFSLIMISLGAVSYLRYRGFKGISLFSLTLSGLGLFFGFIPYPVGALLTLGEIPALGYLALGLSLLSRYPLVGSFILGISVFGGKMVNIAFCIPVLFFWVWSQNIHWRGALKMLLSFVAPEFLWFGIIFIYAGIAEGLQWIEGLFHMIFWMGTLAAGKTSNRIPFLDRFTNPALEWSGYPVALKIKIILMLLVPLVLLVVLLAKQKISPRSNLKFLDYPILTALACGEMVFGFWYFALHPFMWLRHIQLAVAVGLGCLRWVMVQALKAPEKKLAYFGTLGLMALLLLSRLR